MRHYIVTGTSRGLGAALAHSLLAPQHRLTCITRTADAALQAAADSIGCPLEQHSLDLANPDGLAAEIERLLANIDTQNLQGLYLFNNAGSVAPIKPASHSPAATVISSINLNLLAPILLTSAFLRNFAALAADKQIIQISSGAAHKNIPGWSTYCASKAGLERFTEVAALEQQTAAYPIRLLSFAPGVMDTDMQAEIRASDPDDFPPLAHFIGLKEQQQLLSTEQVAKALIELLADPEPANGDFIDVRHRL